MLESPVQHQPKEGKCIAKKNWKFPGEFAGESKARVRVTKHPKQLLGHGAILQVVELELDPEHVAPP